MWPSDTNEVSTYAGEDSFQRCYIKNVRLVLILSGLEHLLIVDRKTLEKNHNALKRTLKQTKPYISL